MSARDLSTQYVAAGAVISPCGAYRYRLWREWRGSGRPEHWRWFTEDDDKTPVVDGSGAALGEPMACVFVMLNPSTADGRQDDPTVRRCVAFAKSWGYNRLEVVNLFAWRATDPQVILAMGGRHTADPVGVDNQRHFNRAIDSQAKLVVCAWGTLGGHLDQDETGLGWIEAAGGTPHALRLSKGRFPAHPLYLPGSLSPVPYRGRKYRP